MRVLWEDKALFVDVGAEPFILRLVNTFFIVQSLNV